MFDSNYIDILQKIYKDFERCISRVLGNFGAYLCIYLLKMIVEFGEYISKHLSIIIFKFKTTCFKV